MNKRIAILCRRYIDWENKGIKHGKLNSHFNKAHPFDQLNQSWTTFNPHIPLERYRHSLHKIAVCSWQQTGADIFFNEVQLSADGGGSMNETTIQQLREYEWIIPIDDDDWLAPSLAQNLLKIDASTQKPAITCWNTSSIHFSKGRAIMDSPYTPYLPATAAWEKGKIIYSCGYAISKEACRSLNNSMLEDILMHHGEASKMAERVYSAQINTLSAVHVRHVATAGSAGRDDINRSIGQISTPKIWSQSKEGLVFWVDPKEEFGWAKKYWRELMTLHLNLEENRETNFY